MNVIYKYINTDKKEGARFYIGSKAECSIIPLEDGREVLLCNNSKKEYYGSSTSKCLREDLRRGDRFSVEVLEVVGNRDILRERESVFLNDVDAASNEDYYNLTNNTLTPRSSNPNAPSNYLGETNAEIARSRSSLSKRDTFAQKNGFSNFAELYFHVYERYIGGESLADISESFGKHRGYFTRIFTENDIEKAYSECSGAACSDPKFIQEIRNVSSRGVSLHKISDIYKLQLTTVRYIVNTSYVSRSLKNGLREKVSFSVARANNLSDTEAINNIIGLVKEGLSYSEIAKVMRTSTTSVSRVVVSFIRESLEYDESLYYGLDYWKNR